MEDGNVGTSWAEPPDPEFVQEPDDQLLLNVEIATLAQVFDDTGWPYEINGGAGPLEGRDAPIGAHDALSHEWDGHQMIASIAGDDQSILLLQARWRAGIGGDAIPAAIAAVNDWNRATLWGTAVVEVEDEVGHVDFDAALDVRFGATAAQLFAFFRNYATSAYALFGMLDREVLSG